MTTIDVTRVAWRPMSVRDAAWLMGDACDVAAPGFALVELVTEVALVSAKDMNVTAINDVETVRVFWADGEIAFRRIGADEFIASGLVEGAWEGMGKGPRPDETTATTAHAEDGVVEALGSALTRGDGSVVMYEQRLGKPYRVDPSLASADGIDLQVRTYRDSLGALVGARYVTAVAVEFEGGSR